MSCQLFFVQEGASPNTDDDRLTQYDFVVHYSSQKESCEPMADMLQHVKSNLPGYEIKTDTTTGGTFRTRFRYVGYINPGSEPEDYGAIVSTVIHYYRLEKWYGLDEEGLVQYSFIPPPEA